MLCALTQDSRTATFVNNDPHFHTGYFILAKKMGPALYFHGFNHELFIRNFQLSITVARTE